MSELTVEKVSELKVTELKEHLQARKLDTKGKKAELVSRLEEALKKEKEQKPKAAVAAPAATTNNTSLKPNAPATATETKKEEAPKVIPTPTAAKPTPTTVSNASTTPAAETPSNADESNQDNDKPLTDNEKRQRRAERFKSEFASTGIQPSTSGNANEDEKMKQRAARFGTTQSSAPPPGKAVLDSKLMERAKRFGFPIKQSGSGATSPTQMQERINRFKSPNMKWAAGSAATPTVAATSTTPTQGARKSADSIATTSVNDEDERKRKRAERFSASNGDSAKKQKVNE